MTSALSWCCFWCGRAMYQTVHGRDRTAATPHEVWRHSRRSAIMYGQTKNRHPRDAGWHTTRMAGTGGSRDTSAMCHALPSSSTRSADIWLPAGFECCSSPGATRSNWPLSYLSQTGRIAAPHWLASSP